MRSLPHRDPEWSPRRRAKPGRRPSIKGFSAVGMGLGVLGLMTASFLAGWVAALGPVHRALNQLHQDIRAVQAQRPLVVHPINLWAGLAGFVVGMLVMAIGNHWLRPNHSSSVVLPEPAAEGDAAEKEDESTT